MTCVRRAWLELGTETLALEDTDAGYACTSLDLGYPEVREVVSNRPDQNGVDDRTGLFGSRAVSADIVTAGSGYLTPDEIATLFAPWMLPGLRPELHYVLDRPGAPERVLIVRAAGYGWPISGGQSRDVQLSWVASDPIMRDPETNTATAYAGSGTVSGRTYPLVFPRTYPTGGGSPSTGTISSPGDVPIRPLLRIYGPITTPVVTLQVSNPPPAPTTTYRVVFIPGFRIDSGHWVDVDTAAKTALTDTGANVMAQIDWMSSAWPVLPTAPAVTYMTLTGTTTSPITQVVAMWSDGYLT